MVCVRKEGITFVLVFGLFIIKRNEALSSNENGGKSPFEAAFSNIFFNFNNKENNTVDNNFDSKNHLYNPSTTPRSFMDIFTTMPMVLVKSGVLDSNPYGNLNLAESAKSANFSGNSISDENRVTRWPPPRSEVLQSTTASPKDLAKPTVATKQKREFVPKQLDVEISSRGERKKKNNVFPILVTPHPETLRGPTLRSKRKIAKNSKISAERRSYSYNPPTENQPKLIYERKRQPSKSATTKYAVKQPSSLSYQSFTIGSDKDDTTTPISVFNDVVFNDDSYGNPQTEVQRERPETRAKTDVSQLPIEALFKTVSPGYVASTTARPNFDTGPSKPPMLLAPQPTQNPFLAQPKQDHPEFIPVMIMVRNPAFVTNSNSQTDTSYAAPSVLAFANNQEMPVNSASPVSYVESNDLLSNQHQQTYSSQTSLPARQSTIRRPQTSYSVFSNSNRPPTVQSPVQDAQYSPPSSTSATSTTSLTSLRPPTTSYSSPNTSISTFASNQDDALRPITQSSASNRGRQNVGRRRRPQTTQDSYGTPLAAPVAATTTTATTEGQQSSSESNPFLTSSETSTEQSSTYRAPSTTRNTIPNYSRPKSRSRDRNLIPTSYRAPQRASSTTETPPSSSYSSFSIGQPNRSSSRTSTSTSTSSEAATSRATSTTSTEASSTEASTSTTTEKSDGGLKVKLRNDDDRNGNVEQSINLHINVVVKGGQDVEDATAEVEVGKDGNVVTSNVAPTLIRRKVQTISMRNGSVPVVINVSRMSGQKFDTRLSSTSGRVSSSSSSLPTYSSASSQTSSSATSSSSSRGATAPSSLPTYSSSTSTASTASSLPTSGSSSRLPSTSTYSAASSTLLTESNASGPVFGNTAQNVASTDSSVSRGVPSLTTHSAPQTQVSSTSNVVAPSSSASPSSWPVYSGSISSSSGQTSASNSASISSALPASAVYSGPSSLSSSTGLSTETLTGATRTTGNSASIPAGSGVSTSVNSVPSRTATASGALPVYSAPAGTSTGVSNSVPSVKDNSGQPVLASQLPVYGGGGSASTSISPASGSVAPVQPGVSAPAVYSGPQTGPSSLGSGVSNVPNSVPDLSTPVSNPINVGSTSLPTYGISASVGNVATIVNQNQQPVSSYQGPNSVPVINDSPTIAPQVSTALPVSVSSIPTYSVATPTPSVTSTTAAPTVSTTANPFLSNNAVSTTTRPAYQSTVTTAQPVSITPATVTQAVTVQPATATYSANGATTATPVKSTTLNQAPILSRYQPQIGSTRTQQPINQAPNLPNVVSTTRPERPRYVVRRRKRPRKRPSITFQDQLGVMKPSYKSQPNVNHFGTSRPNGVKTTSNPNRHRSPTTPVSNLSGSYRSPPTGPAFQALLENAGVSYSPPIQPVQNVISQQQPIQPISTTYSSTTTTTTRPQVSSTISSILNQHDPASNIKTPYEYDAPDVTLEDYYEDAFEALYAYDYDQSDILELYTYDDDGSENSWSLDGRGKNNYSPPPPSSISSSYAVGEETFGSDQNSHKDIRGQGHVEGVKNDLNTSYKTPIPKQNDDSYGVPRGNPIKTPKKSNKNRLRHKRPYSYSTVRAPSYSYSTTSQDDGRSIKPSLLKNLVSKLRHSTPKPTSRPYKRPRPTQHPTAVSYSVYKTPEPVHTTQSYRSPTPKPAYHPTSPRPTYRPSPSPTPVSYSVYKSPEPEYPTQSYEQPKPKPTYKPETHKYSPYPKRYHPRELFDHDAKYRHHRKKNKYNSDGDLIPSLGNVAKHSDWDVMDFTDWAKKIPSYQDDEHEEKEHVDHHDYQQYYEEYLNKHLKEQEQYEQEEHLNNHPNYYQKSYQQFQQKYPKYGKYRPDFKDQEQDFEDHFEQHPIEFGHEYEPRHPRFYEEEPLPQISNPFKDEIPNFSLTEIHPDTSTSFDELIRYKKHRRYLPVKLLQNRNDDEIEAGTTDDAETFGIGFEEWLGKFGVEKKKKGENMGNGSDGVGNKS